MARLEPPTARISAATKAHDEAELDAAVNLALRYDNVVIIEEAVTGREIEVAVLGDTAPETSVPGPMAS